MKTLILLFLGSAYIYASSAFIAPAELKSKLGNSNLVIIDTTDATTYKEGHIPSAVRVEISEFRHQVGKYQLMNSSQEIESVARSLGINNDSEVVIYGHNKGKEILKASYIALSLMVNGHKNVSILNGGFPEWQAEYEFEDLVSKKVEKNKCGNFTANFNTNVLVNLDYVKDAISKIDMIEARPKRFFTGEAQSPGVKRLGHITGAKSSFWREKLDHNYYVKSDKELSDIYIKGNKLNKDREVITYCTGGLEASMNWFVLSAHLGFKDVKVYDGSMRQWGNLDDTPMEK